MHIYFGMTARILYWKYFSFEIKFFALDMIPQNLVNDSPAEKSNNTVDKEIMNS